MVAGVRAVDSPDPEAPPSLQKPAVERRSEPRRVIQSERFESLWLICRDGAIGGQATIYDISTNGLCLELDRRGAWRLIAALREAEANQELIRVLRLPYARPRLARVVWSSDDRISPRIGLFLTEPLGAWTLDTGG